MSQTMMHNDFNIQITSVPSAEHGVCEASFDITLPRAIGTPMLSIDEGTPLHIDTTMTDVDQGILVQFSFDATLTGQCVRCADPITRDVSVSSSQMYFDEAERQHLIDAGDEEAADLPVINGDFIDLEPAVVDAVVPQIPYQPLCSDDCQGLCSVCGKKFADLEPGHEHRVVDPRFAKLAALLPEEGDNEQ